jgi:hypothetical protein
MACELTTGFNLDCKDSWGGIKEIFLQQHEDFATGIVYDGTSGEVEDLPTATLYRYVCEKNTGSMVSAVNANEQGSVTFTTTVTAQLRKITTTKRKELMTLAKNRLAVFVRDMNDNIWFCGRFRGMELTGGDFTTGTALGDFNGVNLVLSGEEIDIPIKVEAFTTNPFDNAAFAITVSPAYPGS